MNIRKFIITALAACTIGSAAILPAAAYGHEVNCGSVSCYGSLAKTVTGSYGRATVDYRGRNTGIINMEATGNISTTNHGSFHKSNGHTYSHTSSWGCIWAAPAGGGSYNQIAYTDYCTTNYTLSKNNLVTYHNGRKYTSIMTDVWSKFSSDSYRQRYTYTLTR